MSLLDLINFFLRKSSNRNFTLCHVIWMRIYIHLDLFDHSHLLQKFSVSTLNLSAMASNIDWALILRDRFATFKVEENAFLESLKICNSSEVAIERIYEAIKR